MTAGKKGMRIADRGLRNNRLPRHIPQSAFPSSRLLVVVLGAISVILSRSPLMSSHEIAQSIVCHAAEIHIAPFTARARGSYFSCTVRNSCSAGLVGTVSAVALTHSPRRWPYQLFWPIWPFSLNSLVGWRSLSVL